MNECKHELIPYMPYRGTQCRKCDYKEEQPCPSCEELHKANKQFQVLCGELTFENVGLKEELQAERDKIGSDFIEHQVEIKELKQNWLECEEQKRVSWTKEKDAVEKYKALREKLEGVVEILNKMDDCIPDIHTAIKHTDVLYYKRQAIDMIKEMLK